MGCIGLELVMLHYASQKSLKIMAKAGCAHLVYGYEDFDDRILKLMGKGSTRKRISEAFFDF